MESKIKYVILFITILYQVAFGCKYDVLNCTINIRCSSQEFVRYALDDIGYDISYCPRIFNQLYGNDILPMHVFITDYIKTETDIPVIDHSYLLRGIFGLDITNNNLEITPTLKEMINLKTLNLSDNMLQEANLYNKNKLIELQDVDLSHNFIRSIQVNENEYIYENLHKLDLSHNILTNISGGTFYSFKFLEELNLSYNNLVTIDHYTFEGLKNLKYLYLSHNKISDINLSLFRFIYLEELYLDDNYIENLLHRDLEKLERLQKLNLDFNKISRIEKDTFNSTVSLSTLKLHHNLLNFINKDAFTFTTSLNTVDLSSNFIKNLPKDLFKDKSIKSFSITNNNLDGAISRGTFEGLIVTRLEISFQSITAIDEYAFFGLGTITTLLLNNNKIHTISEHAFNTLNNLNHLDLSNNLITNLNFDTRDLLSLETYLLGNNFIEQIRSENFHELKTLRLLDISDNNITKLEPNSFTSAETIENFEMSHNPLTGTLLKNSFYGLSSIPMLDLSCALLTSIQNESFSGMTQLQDLNISRSSINTLEYNAFMNTGSIKLIDLSYNKLVDFFVNTTDLKNLTTILLNNNQLIRISSHYFIDMLLLRKVVVSHNLLQKIDNNAFEKQIDLIYLDLSFNDNLTFHMSIIGNARNLDKLLLSSTKYETGFTNISSNTLKHLEISHSRILNVSKIYLNSMKYLTNLVLNHNNIIKVEKSAFKNLNVLERLDLSFNNISSIEPGSFKDNILMTKLNLSHNSLTNLNYGIFRGLISLSILDVSFNSIHDLLRGKFYDLPNLNTLLVDYNKITDINEDFFGITLSVLSIGDNPLPCEKIVYMQTKGQFQVTAINIDEHSGDNINGITCIMYNLVPEVKVDVNNLKESDKILFSIKEILLNLSIANRDIKSSSESINSDILKNILDKLEHYGTDQNNDEIKLKNITSQLSQMTNEADRTNSFLERILKAVVGFGSLQIKPITINTNNATANKNNTGFSEKTSKLEDLILDVSQVKQELLYLENIISEIDRKVSVDKSVSKPLVSENVNKSDIIVDRNTGKSFIFVEVCVSLILVMLVCFFLYKFYQSKMFVPSSRSLSTRHISDAMDNSNL